MRDDRKWWEDPKSLKVKKRLTLGVAETTTGKA